MPVEACNCASCGARWPHLESRLIVSLGTSHRPRAPFLAALNRVETGVTLYPGSAMLSFALLVVFIFCGLIYARASKTLTRLDRLRLEKEPPAQPEPILHAATEFARRVGIPMAPGNEELMAFCARNGLTPEYTRANRLLFGSLLVALACAYGVIKLGPIKG